MKYLKSFNESVRDLMTPKSEEDIKNSISGMQYHELKKIFLVAISKGQIDIVKILLDTRIDIHNHNEEALRTAIRFNQTEMTKYLIENGANINNNEVLLCIKYYPHYESTKLIQKLLQTNESVRDKMTGKSKEEVLKSLEGKPYLYIISKIKQYKLNIDDLFTKEEQEKIKTNGFCYIDDDLKTLFVDRKGLIHVVSCVGEGVRDIWDDSNQIYPKEYQNEIVITFWENAWGGVSLEEWNELNKRLKEFEGKNGFNSYDINTETLKLIMSFDSEYPMEEL